MLTCGKGEFIWIYAAKMCSFPEAEPKEQSVKVPQEKQHIFEDW